MWIEKSSLILKKTKKKPDEMSKYTIWKVRYDYSYVRGPKKSQFFPLFIFGGLLVHVYTCFQGTEL